MQKTTLNATNETTNAIIGNAMNLQECPHQRKKFNEPFEKRETKLSIGGARYS